MKRAWRKVVSDASTAQTWYLALVMLLSLLLCVIRGAAL